MSQSRRDFLARSVQLGALLGVGVPLLQACGGSDDERSQVSATIADGLEPEKGPLRIINYADYVNLEVIADFEAPLRVTGPVKVRVFSLATV